MSSSARPDTPPSSGRRHRQGLSISSVLSFLSGAETRTTPIRTINNGPPDSDGSPPRPLLPQVSYPETSSFAFSRMCNDVDTRGLEQSMDATTRDIRRTFSETISDLMRDQQELVAKMNAADAQVKQVLQNTNTRIKKTEKEAEVLAGSERLSILAEKSYEEVEKILKLFREIDGLLPAEERIGHHSSHYEQLAPLVTRVVQRRRPTADPSRGAAATPAVSSLMAIQATSPKPPAEDLRPVPASVSATSTTPVIESPPVEPVQQIGQKPDALPPPRLRLAPRKSRSNLRVPQIKTVPPLPSTQLSTALPTVERDNMSTRSSVASRRSVFSTLSLFLGGQSSRRTVHDSSYAPLTHGNAEERLRKISGGSLLGQTRKK